MAKKNVVIDLNGHVMNTASDVTIKQNDPEAVLVIKDSSAEQTGKVVNTHAEGICAWARRGDIVIENGTFENNSIFESTVYVGTTDAKLDGANPVITIEDGVFNNIAEGEYKWKKGWKPLNLNVINNMKPENIVVKGGVFNGNDPALGDDNLGGTFVAEGYESVEFEGGFKVQKKEKE